MTLHILLLASLACISAVDDSLDYDIEDTNSTIGYSIIDG
jgi:hypothetical protein